MFVKGYIIKERNGTSLLDITRMQSNHLINTQDIYKIDNNTFDHKGEEYCRVYCRHKAADPNMFAFIAFLCVLLVGVPWFICYALGCKVKTTIYYCKVSELKDAGAYLC